MKLSVILIAYDMAREIPRTLASLARGYQQGAATLEYEVLLVDNGSPVPLDADSWRDVDTPVVALSPENPLPSPASAINQAVEQARGEIICLMIDGAHLLTPGVFRLALSAFGAFPEPVVGVRYCYLGPDEQPLSIGQGYDEAEEDRLLHSIHWPDDGYALFEIGTPLRAGARNITWFNRMFESNCLFLRRDLLLSLGGADERFDQPGGGFLNLDLYKRAQEADGVTPVQLVGEGSFHQLHGGTTTNVDSEARESRLAAYLDQYQRLRGHSELMTNKDVFFLGHLPTTASKIHLRRYPRDQHQEND